MRTLYMEAEEDNSEEAIERSQEVSEDSISISK